MTNLSSTAPAEWADALDSLSELLEALPEHERYAMAPALLVVFRAAHGFVEFMLETLGDDAAPALHPVLLALQRVESLARGRLKAIS